MKIRKISAFRFYSITLINKVILPPFEEGGRGRIEKKRMESVILSAVNANIQTLNLFKSTAWLWIKNESLKTVIELLGVHVWKIYMRAKLEVVINLCAIEGGIELHEKTITANANKINLKRKQIRKKFHAGSLRSNYSNKKQEYSWRK